MGIIRVFYSLLFLVAAVKVDEYDDGTAYWDASRMSVISSKTRKDGDTYTAPSTIGNVVLVVESVGFWHLDDPAGSHVLDCASLATNVLVIFRTTSVPYSAAFLRPLDCERGRCCSSFARWGSFILRQSRE